MTFKVVSVNEAQERVVATVWAEAETQAELLASSFFSTSQQGAVHVRRAVDCEIPMRIAEPAFTSPFLS